MLIVCNSEPCLPSDKVVRNYFLCAASHLILGSSGVQQLVPQMRSWCTTATLSTGHTAIQTPDEATNAFRACRMAQRRDLM